MLHPQETAPALPPELAALAAGGSHDPFASRGWHRGAADWTFRTLQPDRERRDGPRLGAARALPDTPLFELRAAGAPPEHTRLRLSAGGATHDLIDPYSFPPAIGAEDLWLFNSGAARQAWRALGAHAIERDSTYYGGANLGNAGGIAAEDRPYMGLACSVTLTLPPLACAVLAPA